MSLSPSCPSRLSFSCRIKVRLPPDLHTAHHQSKAPQGINALSSPLDFCKAVRLRSSLVLVDLKREGSSEPGMFSAAILPFLLLGHHPFHQGGVYEEHDHSYDGDC